uniref:Uncharacterized protein n=1 Tax=Leersia perrieri TaxID=77586 RepID=A0A0D9V964_9ORYZ
MGPDEVFGAKEVGRVSSFFDTMSLVLDFVPLIIAVFFDWKRTMKHVSPFPLFSGTIVNVLLVYHIMFVVDTEKHKATLYVATVGLVMGSVYVFLVGVRDSASGDKWSGIFWVCKLK